MKKRILSRTLTASLAAVLASCAVSPTGREEALALERSSGGSKGTVPDTYVLLQPEATGLRTAADDGKNTYLEFSIVVPRELKVFDGDGRSLEVATSGTLLGMAGLHEGILVRLGVATSFVGLPGGAQRPTPADLPESAELKQVRDKLRESDPMHKAMQRAIQRTSERQRTEAGGSR
jgi:hypothetical protein